MSKINLNMDVDGVQVTVPILCMCRLCLNYSENYEEIGTDQSSLIIRDKIQKYLYLEVKTSYSLIIFLLRIKTIILHLKKEYS